MHGVKQSSKCETPSAGLGSSAQVCVEQHQLQQQLNFDKRLALTTTNIVNTNENVQLSREDQCLNTINTRKVRSSGIKVTAASRYDEKERDDSDEPNQYIV